MSERFLPLIMKPSLCLIAALIFTSFYGMDTQAQATVSGGNRQTAKEEHAGLTHPVRRLNSDIVAYGIELAEAERAYDATLYQVLSYFFVPGTFLLDVRLEAEPRITDIHTTTPEKAIHTITSLPGLPHFEEETTIPGSSSTSISRFFTGMELKRLHITVYADSSYVEGELDFMKQLIMAAAKVENSRGDQVHIISQSFPEELMPPGKKATAKLDGEKIDGDDTHVREIFGLQMTRRITELPGLVLLISSAVLIFLIIFFAITLHKKYV